MPKSRLCTNWRLALNFVKITRCTIIWMRGQQNEVVFLVETCSFAWYSCNSLSLEFAYGTCLESFSSIVDICGNLDSWVCRDPLSWVFRRALRMLIEMKLVPPWRETLSRKIRAAKYFLEFALLANGSRVKMKLLNAPGQSSYNLLTVRSAASERSHLRTEDWIR